jgi:hypothetical protein
MLQRGWGILSSKEWGRRILPRTVNKQAGPGWKGPGGSGGTCPATRNEKACESGRGRKTPQERGEDPPPMSAVNKHCCWQEQQHHPAIRSRKACKRGGGRKTPHESGEDPLPM